MDSKLKATGYDSKGNVVAEEFICTKDNCNCVGRWTNGNPSEVVEWIDEPDDDDN